MLMVKEEEQDAAFIQKNGKTFDIVVDDREQGWSGQPDQPDAPDRSDTSDMSNRSDRSDAKARIREQLELYFGARVHDSCLPCGDFVIEEKICVKRYTAREFILSIIQGSIFHQAVRMNECYERPLVIIEGDLEATGYKVHPHAVKGAVTNLIMRWNIPVLFSNRMEETVLLLWLIGTQEAVARSSKHKRHGRSPRDRERQRLYVLQGFADIGPALAARILAHFGSLRAFINASVEELAEVKGIGGEIAGQIHDAAAGDD